MPQLRKAASSHYTASRRNTESKLDYGEYRALMYWASPGATDVLVIDMGEPVASYVGVANTVVQPGLWSTRKSRRIRFAPPWKYGPMTKILFFRSADCRGKYSPEPNGRSLYLSLHRQRESSRTTCVSSPLQGANYRKKGGGRVRDILRLIPKTKTPEYAPVTSLDPEIKRKSLPTMYV